MKKCLHCGAENPADATRCEKCGQLDFDIGASPSTKRLAREDLKFRLFVSSVVFLIVSGISLYVAWGNARKMPDGDEQYRTQISLREAANDIQRYRSQFGTAPQSLEDLKKITVGSSFEADSSSPDGWQRPFIFTNNGTNLVVLSYGRDGKPGGTGQDFDLSTENLKTMDTGLTLSQFLLEQPTSGMVLSCLACGLMAGLLCFFYTKIPVVLDSTDVIVIVGRLVLIALAAIFTAGVAAALHLPFHSH